MEARYPGRAIRTRDAIERTAAVVIGTLVEPGVVSPGPPGAHDVDDASFRIERMLTPPAAGVATISGTVKVSYTQQVFPEAEAEAPLERGRPYVLFCTAPAPKRLYALKVVPHSEDAVRVVASAFAGGARHAPAGPGARLA